MLSSTSPPGWLRVASIYLEVAILVTVGSVQEIPDPVGTDDTDYCSDDFACGTQKHFACTHSKEVRTDRCTLVVYVTPKDRGSFLEVVNDFRNRVAQGGELQPASDMRQLTWDYKLEHLAKLLGHYIYETGDKEIDWSLSPWVRVCSKMAGLGSTTAIADAYPTGLNLKTTYGIWTSKPPSQDEIHRFKVAESSTDGGPDFSDQFKYIWTALAWANATKLGCAHTDVICKDTNMHTLVPVCFIGGGTNVEGSPVYEPGPACSNCPPYTECDKSSQWPKLCTEEHPKSKKNAAASNKSEVSTQKKTRHEKPTTATKKYDHTKKSIRVSPSSACSVQHRTFIPLLITSLYVSKGICCVK